VGPVWTGSLGRFLTIGNPSTHPAAGHAAGHASEGAAEVASEGAAEVASEGAAEVASGSVQAAVSSVQWFAASINLESLVVLIGGAFIIYTAIKEIYHMLAQHDLSHRERQEKRSAGAAIFWIIVMNLVFSIDSILSAMALTENMLLISLAILASGLAMIYMSNTVTQFLKKNRMYEVLSLFILFIVGIMLISEGGHQAHLTFFGNEVTAMNKGTFYFVLAVLVVGGRGPIPVSKETFGPSRCRF